MKGSVPLIAWIVVGVALFISFVADFNNVGQGGAIDLRNRITGARLLEDGRDAYHYKWHYGEPEKYADVYNNPKLTVSKTTASPALLLLHLPLAGMPYRLAQYVWFFLQWLFLAGTGWLWWRVCATPRQRLLVALAMTGFTYTAAWRLHAERGQAYVLLAFLLAAWMVLTLDEKRSRRFVVSCAAGFLAGLLVALRPTFALLLPFLALHRRAQLAGVAVGLALGIGLPMLPHEAAWPEYIVAMQQNSEYYRDGFDPRPGRQHYPGIIEGTSTQIMAHYVAIPYADFSAQALLHALGIVAFPALPVLLVWAVPFAFWLWFSRRQPVASLLPAVAAWAFLADLFLPAYRDSYNDVLILDVLAPVLAVAPRFPWVAWPAVVALPMGLWIYAYSPDQPWLINVPTALFAVSAVWVVFAVGKNGAGGTYGTNRQGLSPQLPRQGRNLQP